MDYTSASDAELEALQRALLEARFCTESRDDDIWASPLVIDLHVAVVDELQRRATAAGSRRAARIQEWLEWGGHSIEQRIMIQRLHSDSYWSSLAVSDRMGYLKRLIRPFRAGDAVLRDFYQRIQEGQPSH
jgi:hypothetical protein